MSRSFNVNGDDGRFVRVSGEAQRETGIPRKLIYAAARQGKITIYKLKGGGRISWVRLQCLKALAEEVFEPSDRPPLTEH
jgi:hypothetical protein